MMGAWLEEVKNAMRTSSLKGVSRIISAPTDLHRSIWTVAVICFFGVCMLIVSLNIRAYLAYPKVVNVEEKPINHLDPNGTVPFPTIAVCNLNPLGSNKSVFEEYGIPLLKDYLMKVAEVTRCVNCSMEKKEFTDIVRTYLMAARGYYQYIGLESMYKVGNQHFILHCQATVLAGPSLMAFPCHKVTTNYTFMHHDAGICYAYDPKPSNKVMIVGYVFTVHLDSAVDNLNNEFETDLVPPPSAGAAMYAYDPYTAPNLLGAVSRLHPGAYTSLCLKAIRTDRLSIPYSERECFNADEYEKVYTHNKLFNYDEMSCLGQCISQYIIEQCNCTDLWSIQIPEYEAPKYQYCASLKSADTIYETILCAEKMRPLAYMNCQGKCREPCHETKYSLIQNTGKWPLPSQLGSFYTNFIEKNSYLHNKYKTYEKIAKALVANYRNVSQTDILLLKNVIQDNFAVGSLLAFDRYYTHFESKAKFTADSLISQLGGSLNLWSGITVVIFVEMIDFLITCLNRRKDEKKVNHDSIPLESKSGVGHQTLYL